MAENSTPKIAVVGRNVSAALWLKAARQASPDALLSWHQTDNERWNPTDAPFWLVWPERLARELGDWAPLLHVPNPTLFLGRAHRQLTRSFLESCEQVPLPVRRKWLAASLWSDLTPSQWRGPVKSGRRREPDPRWVNALPESFGPLLHEGICLVPRHLALALCLRKLMELGVEIAHGERGVLGIEPGARGEGQRLVHNAPLGFSQATHVLWTSVARDLKDETARPGKRLKSLSQTEAGAWVSFGAWVPSDQVAALPLFSLWHEPRTVGEFLRTGLLISRGVKRVLCIDAAYIQGPKNHSWLQIDELELAGEGEMSPNPAAFLSEICPRLQTSFQEERLEENHVFERPIPCQESLASGIEFWFNSTLGSPANMAAEWMSRHVPPRRKPANPATP